MTFKGHGPSGGRNETEYVEANSPEEAIQAFNEKRGSTIYADEHYEVSVGGITQRVRTTLPDLCREDGVLYVPVATKAAHR